MAHEEPTSVFATNALLSLYQGASLGAQLRFWIDTMAALSFDAAIPVELSGDDVVLLRAFLQRLGEQVGGID
jgi:hypothetical protein